MKTEVLLKLLEAGYTKKEIDLMEEVEKKPETEKENPAPETEKENPAPETEKENPAPETDTAAQVGKLMKIVSNLQKSVEALQKSNAEKAESKTESRITADSVIKDFFAPTKRKG